MSCINCVYARKAINENAIACSLWSSNDRGDLINGEADWFGEIYEGWAYINEPWYRGPAKKHGMMTNNCVLMPTYGSCNMKRKKVCVAGKYS